MDLNLNSSGTMNTNSSKTGRHLPSSAGFQTCRLADFPVGRSPDKPCVVVGRGVPTAPFWGVAGVGGAPGFFTGLLALCALLMALCPWRAFAQIPEPDNVVYGQIALGTNLVTAQRTNVLVEVQNTNGLVVSTYRMGQDSNLGDHYAVPIVFWSPANVLQPLPSPTGETLTLFVKETVFVAGRATNLTRYQTNFVVGDRGYVERIDFGELPAAPSGFEAWAALYGLAPGSQNLDADGDGLSNRREFVAGTDPNDPNSLFALEIAHGADNVALSFVALPAAGTGYAGVTRYYSLQAAEDPQGPWVYLPQYRDIPGDGQRHVCVMPATNSLPQFYRGQVDLR